jgi:protein-disulfide isomerase
LKVVVKQYVVHPDTATIPSLAVCAAQKQNKFAAMEKLVWEKGWQTERPTNLSRETMDGFARELKLDLNKFKADMDSDACKQQLSSNQSLLGRVGVRGTPAFFINGRYLVGAVPIDRFKQIIDEELKKADEAIKKGTKLQDYYASLVAQGKKSI